MSKHTPGPWAYELSDNFAIFAVEDCSTYIAEAYMREEDARLIVASPDLLDVAEMFLRYINDNGGPDAYTQHAAVSAAIAKAKGE